MLLGVVFAVLAAAVNAAGSVMQRTGARKQPEGSRLSRSMLWHLVDQPVWLAGVLATLGGLVLQAVALGNAPIVLVQALLVSELGTPSSRSRGGSRCSTSTCAAVSGSSLS